MKKGWIALLAVGAAGYWLGRGGEWKNTAVEWTKERFAGVEWPWEEGMPRVEEMTAEQRRALAAWGAGGKRMAAAKAEGLRARLEGREEGGYACREDDARKARKTLAAYEKAIDRDRWDKAVALGEEAEEAVDAFEKGCRWRPGMRHKVYGHIHASWTEGQWEADTGWVFPRDESLETAAVCGWCGGQGTEEAWTTCARCNGTGTVETPMAPATKFFRDAAVVAGAAVEVCAGAKDTGRALRGKATGGGRAHVDLLGLAGSMEVPTQDCPGCNGRGETKEPRRCSHCGGKGYVR